VYMMRQAFKSASRVSSSAGMGALSMTSEA
jgi:hypothetical protein